MYVYICIYIFKYIYIYMTYSIPRNDTSNNTNWLTQGECNLVRIFARNSLALHFVGPACKISKVFDRQGCTARYWHCVAYVCMCMCVRARVCMSTDELMSG